MSDAFHKNFLKTAHRPAVNFPLSQMLLSNATSIVTKQLQMPWYSVRKDLGLDNIDTCVGYEHSEGRRCRSPTSLFMKDLASMTFEIWSHDGIHWEQLTHDHPDEDISMNALSSSLVTYSARSIFGIKNVP